MSQRKYPIVALLSLAFFATSALAQSPQAPSQRYSPERNVPPSVHVPDAAAKPLNSNNSLRSTSATTFNFSDTPASNFRQSTVSGRDYNRSGARQVAYMQENNKKQNQMIPSELKESAVAGAPKTAISKFQPPLSKMNRLVSQQAENGTAAQGIVVDQSQFQKFNTKAASRNSEAAKQVTQSANTPIARIPAAPMQREAVDQVAFARQSQQQDPVRSAEYKATAMPEIGQRIKKVSSESEVLSSGATLEMSVPAIRVQCFGPESIGVNKIATYKVTVSNDSNHDAKDLQVGIGMPAAIELQNINISTGHHEVADAADQSRLKWNIERLPAGVTHTIALNTIARSADPFDLEVAWAFAPQTASTQVRVTEPKLEMKIAGPDEVLFGEKVTYDVTISNPGTGNAEQVSVMLPAELGGERASIGDVGPGDEKKFKVELLARTAGRLNLAASAIGDGNITAKAEHEILVRRANLMVKIEGPPMKYAGGLGQYMVTVANEGDARASGVTAVLAMPNGVKYLGGIKNAVTNDAGGLKWQIGSLNAGDRKMFKVNCQLDASGSLMFQAGARGAGDLASTHECQTQVDTIADLTLDVDDPKGPFPTGEDVNYKLVIRNRGTRSANKVNVVMHFAEGIEPIKAEGIKHKIGVGQVVFDPISRIEPGQEIVLRVVAQANKSGTHIFRGQLTCAESDSREIDEGTTRFFGDSIGNARQQLTLPSKANTADASDDVNLNTNDFK